MATFRSIDGFFFSRLMWTGEQSSYKVSWSDPHSSWDDSDILFQWGNVFCSCVFRALRPVLERRCPWCGGWPDAICDQRQLLLDTMQRKTNFFTSPFFESHRGSFCLPNLWYDSSGRSWYSSFNDSFLFSWFFDSSRKWQQIIALTSPAFVRMGACHKAMCFSRSKPICWIFQSSAHEKKYYLSFLSYASSKDCPLGSYWSWGSHCCWIDERLLFSRFSLCLHLLLFILAHASCDRGHWEYEPSIGNIFSPNLGRWEGSGHPWMEESGHALL